MVNMFIGSVSGLKPGTDVKITFQPDRSKRRKINYLLNSAFRFSRNADVPSLKLSVPQQTPNKAAS